MGISSRAWFYFWGKGQLRPKQLILSASYGLRTGDVGVMADDGFIRSVDRLKDIV
ncbi:MAG TPA: hypothetical protein DCX08_10460 [Porticoccaceae bacterium]|nr:hypothetical protein [Porticoccaceae bacterium]